MSEETTKICFKCGERKLLSEFYAHPMMADGHLGKCKVCTKSDVKANRASKRNQYAAYERRRFHTPKRREQRLRYQRARRKKHPEKTKAYAKLRYALKKGTITRPDACQDCGITGAKIEAHHDDYSRPLDVKWLCFECHRTLHLNGKEETCTGACTMPTVSASTALSERRKNYGSSPGGAGE